MTSGEIKIALRCAGIAKAIGAAEFVKNVGYSAGQAIEAAILREFQLDGPTVEVFCAYCGKHEPNPSTHVCEGI